MAEEAIDRIEHSEAIKHDIDKAYNEFMTVINTELDRKVPVKVIKQGSTNASHKSRYKPYCNEDLQNTWNKKVASEKKWLKMVQKKQN